MFALFFYQHEIQQPINELNYLELVHTLSERFKQLPMKLINALQLGLEPIKPDIVSIVGGGGKTSTLYRLAEEIVASGQRVVMTTTTRMGVYQTIGRPFLLEMEENVLPLRELELMLDEYGCCLLARPAEGDKQPGISPSLIDELVEADGSQTLPAKAPADHEPVIAQSTTLLVPMLGLDAVGRLIDTDYMHRPHLIRTLLDISPGADTLRLTPAYAAQLLIHPNGGAKFLPTKARLLPLLNKADNAPSLAMARLIAHQLANRQQPSLIGTVGIKTHEPVRERWSAQAIVVLAAGASRRMGRAKQLEVVDGEPMIVRAAQVALHSGADQVFVVIGSYANEVTLLLEPLKELIGERLQLVYNPDWETGQASSVRAGISALSSTVGSVLFMPVDQPYLSPALLRRLLSAWRKGARLAAPHVAGRLRGAPAIFDATLWPELLKITGDVGARSLLKKYQDQLVILEAEADQLRDIDSPEDLLLDK